MSSATLLDLDAVDATQIARSLHAKTAPASYVIDCSRLESLRTAGVSHVISQLLVLGQAGAVIRLRNVSPVLRRCLHLLKLQHLLDETAETLA